MAMERGQFEVILEARNRAAGTLRQFGSQIRRAMDQARNAVRRTGQEMRRSAEGLEGLGRGGRVVSGVLRGLSALALQPLIGLLSLGLTGVMALAGGFMRLATAAVNFARTIVTQVLVALRNLIRTASRVALVLGSTLVIAFGVATNKAAGFEQEMRNVNVIVRASEAQFAGMTAEVLKLSTVVPQTAEVLARGLYNIASAGFKGAEGLEVLTASAYAAVAGIAETDEAAKALTGVLNAYGFAADQAQRVSDILFKTVERGVVTFPELAQYIGMVVSTAAAASVPFEELAAAFMTMTKGSIHASVATTALNRIVLSFLSPSEKLEQALKAIGIESAGTFIQTQGLGEAIKALNQIAEGNPAILAAIGLEMRALRAAMSLVREEGRIFAEDIRAAYNAAGATQAAYAEQSKALRVQIALMKSSFAALAITIGQALLPVLEPAIQGIGRIATAIKDWIDTHPELVQRIERLGAVVREIFDRAEQRVGDWLSWFSENWQSLWSRATDAVDSAAATISQAVGGIIELLAYLSAEGGQKVREWAQAVVNALSRAYVWIAERTVPALRMLIATMKSLGGVTAWLLEWLTPTYQGMLEMWGDVRAQLDVLDRELQEFDERYGRPPNLAKWFEDISKPGTFLGGARQAWGAGREAGEAWYSGFREIVTAALAEVPAGPTAAALAGIEQVGPGAWMFPVAEGAKKALEEAAPAIAEEVPKAVTTYTAAEQIDWGQAMAQLAEVEQRFGDAIWYLAHAAGYQEEIVAGLRAAYDVEATAETAKELAEAIRSLQGFYQTGGRVWQQMGPQEQQWTAQLAQQPVPWVFAPNIHIDKVGSAEDFAQIGYDLFYRIWQDEQLGDEAMYGGWTGG